LNREPID